MSRIVITNIKNKIGTLTLNRPNSLNAMSWDLLQDIFKGIKELTDSDKVKVIVIKGEGPHFCAGGDIKEMNKGSFTKSKNNRQEPIIKSLRENMEFIRILHETPKPTIAMLRGAVAGAGFSFACACDIRLASDTIYMTTAFAKIGVSGDYGGSYFLTHLVGPSKAKELYFTAKPILAEEALSLGLVNHIIPNAELEKETNKLAKQLAAGPPLAYYYMKKNFNAVFSSTLSQQLDRETEHMIQCMTTEDHKEATNAFIEKRSSKFKGK